MPDLQDNPFTAIAGCRLPIQLAPMPGPVTPELALAVAAAGGHVAYPCVALPAGPLAATLEGLARRTRAISANFIAPMLEQAAFEAALEHVPMVDFHAGRPSPELVERAHAAGCRVGWQVGSLTDARAAEDAGCDLIIAQGNEAGGRAAGTTALLPLLAELAGELELPILAAGGIASAATVRAALSAGADGVRVGTRFIASAESGAHPAWIDALIAARSEEAVVTERFSKGVPVIPHRVLRSSIEGAESHAGELIGEMALGGVIRQMERFESFPPNRSFRGDVRAMPMYAGQSAGVVREVLPAAEIVAELATGIPSALAA
jgi:nitronate monooxygenase